jgi:hypothetical protein
MMFSVENKVSLSFIQVLKSKSDLVPFPLPVVFVFQQYSNEPKSYCEFSLFYIDKCFCFQYQIL